MNVDDFTQNNTIPAEDTTQPVPAAPEAGEQPAAAPAEAAVHWQPYPADGPVPAPTPAVQQPENVVAGIVGALLFAIGGGVVYFILYQVGFIAGICGLIMFVLANFGYQLFSGRKNSMIGVITAAVAMVIMLLLSEYVCVGFEIFQVFKEDYDISFFDALRSVPAFLEEPEILGGVISDLAFALILGVIAAVGSIISAAKAAKKQPPQQ